MIRLFVNNELKKDEQIDLTKNQTHYLLNVMRQKDGDNILIFNGKDGEWVSKIKIESKKLITLNVIEQTRKQKFLKPCILCQGIIKKEKMDLILEKVTELGVTEIIPVITERTVVRKFNKERAELIVQEAAEQSERLCCPKIKDPIYLENLIKSLPEESTVFFLFERNGKDDYKKEKAKTPVFLIGPEGGFTKKEVDFLKCQKCVKPIWLGEQILRAETAAIASISCWQYKNVFD